MSDPEVSDYSPPGPSERHQMADNLARNLFALGLSQEPQAARSVSGKCYFVRFHRDNPPIKGSVQVYGLDYVRINWTIKVPGWEAGGSRLLGSAEATMTFLELAFIEGDRDAALAIPQRIPKRRPKPPE